MGANSIRITGARQHNLKNLTLEIPRQRLVVITGMSGSGKSSLAFDTLFAEGQRRYVESLSAYARQFLGQMQKPDVDFIEGLSPAIAIEQRSSAANPRSTVATTTEVYDYLRLLFASAGQPHDPDTGRPVERLSVQQIVDRILGAPEGTRLVVLAPLVRNEAGEFRDVIEKVRREGFVRVRIDGEIRDLDDPAALRIAGGRRHDIEVVVDRLTARPEARATLADSLETALRWGGNRVLILSQNAGEQAWRQTPYSTDPCDPETGFTLPRLGPKHFSFNGHLGACPTCHGLGTELFCDPELMVPDPEVTLEDGAILPWARAPRRMRPYYRALLEGLAKAYRVGLDVAWKDLPSDFREALLRGTGERAIPAPGAGRGRKAEGHPFEGLIAQMERLHAESESELTRARIRAYMNRRACRACGGARLRREILAVTLADRSGAERNIHDVCRMSVGEALGWVDALSLPPSRAAVVSEVAREIRARLGFLVEVGLDYLTLDRESGTLSGGEAQRIRLATQIGSGLAGVLYVLDEPSIGLHQRDNARLIATLRRLRDLGNSVIVVEHDEETIRAADHVIDLGPGAGPRGGRIVAEGSLERILACPDSLTAQYLRDEQRIPVPRARRAPRTPRGAQSGWLTVRGARENNLREIDAAFPLGCLVCVTGVSGSGKSTLVDDILRRALFRHLYRAKDVPGAHDGVIGLDQIDKAIVIDQSPIGRSPRSNPVTYTGAFGAVRSLFSGLPLSRVRGYGPGRFSFNVRGGRCESCQGDGVIKIEMHFLSDIYVECEVCGGRRYNRETLDVTYKGRNIADVLDLSVDEAIELFRPLPSIAERLRALAEVGLGYLKLGQSGTTLSGGEAQRVKLAGELAKRATGRTVYILDEPTTGLHFADIHRLMEVLLKLRQGGNTLIVIEHNLEVVKCADWVIDLGPEGGEAGGRIVAHGTPEEVAREEGSHTGRYLRHLLR